MDIITDDDILENLFFDDIPDDYCDSEISDSDEKNASSSTVSNFDSVFNNTFQRQFDIENMCENNNESLLVDNHSVPSTSTTTPTLLPSTSKQRKLRKKKVELDVSSMTGAPTKKVCKDKRNVQKEPDIDRKWKKREQEITQLEYNIQEGK